MKKTFWIAIMLAAVSLLPACSPRSRQEEEDPTAVLGTRTKYTFSDMVYACDLAFTFYKPEEYDIVKGSGEIVEINGNAHDLRSYFKRYKVKVEEVLYSNGGEKFDEILVREHYRGKDENGESKPDDIEVLKDETLYLGFVYEHPEGEYTPFEYFEIGRKEKLKDSEFARPWKTLEDIRYTYKYELAGGGNIHTPELQEIKANVMMQHGEELFPSFDFNCKILSDEYVASAEYDAPSAKKIEKAENNAGQPYFEVIAYPNGSSKGYSIMYDAETGDAIAWTK